MMLLTSDTKVRVNAVHGITDNGIIRQKHGASAGTSINPAAVYVRPANEGIVGDDIAENGTSSPFHSDPATLCERALGIRRIILDAIVLNAWHAPLHPDAPAEQIANVAGDDVVADRRVTVAHGDSAAVIAATPARDGKAINRWRHLRCGSEYTKDGND